MTHGHPSEVMALRERLDRAEARNQHLNEIISGLRDNEAYLLARVGELQGRVDALRGEMAR